MKKLTIYYILLVEFLLLDVVVLTKFINGLLYLVLKTKINNHCCSFTSSLCIGRIPFYFDESLSQHFHRLFLAMNIVLGQELSQMCIESSLHIEFSPLFGIGLIAKRHILSLILYNIIDCLALQTIEFCAYSIQEATVTVITPHFTHHSLLQYNYYKAMLIPTSNFLSIEVDKKTGQTINSIKIDYAKMAFTPKSADHFTECKYCNALLIQQDSKNNHLSNNKNEYLWNCRFCKRQNASKQLHFVGNNYKYPIQKNLKSKITPPIILFVIDNSGSMSQSIFSGMKYANNPHIIAQAKKSLHHRFGQILNQSKLYQIQKKELHKLEQSFTNVVKSTKYSEEEISKLTFLYAMIEYNLKNLVKKESIKDCRVGFIFFSDMIYVLKGAKQKEIPVYLQDGELCHEQWPYKKQVADFYQYESLFSKGKQYDKYFGDSRLKNIDISKIAINKVKGGGRTALGPALAFAMGVVSVHDQGSRVIVVTDSMPNFGILATGDSDYIYKKIGGCLKDNNAALNILKWSGEQTKSKQEQSFAQFRSAYRQYVQQIELNLTKCKQSQGLQISMTALNNLINKEPIGMSCQVQIYCDNPKIKAQKLAFDFNDYKTLRFLNNNSKCWCTLSINKEVLQEYDFLFPITTQIVIKYSDIFTRERYIFMSYVQQRLFKPNMIQQIKTNEGNETFLEQQEQNINLDNINQLCNLEMLNKYQSNRLLYDQVSQAQDQMKTVFRYKEIQFERDFHGINDIATIQNLLHQEYHTSSNPNEDDYEAL